MEILSIIYTVWQQEKEVAGYIGFTVKKQIEMNSRFQITSTSFLNLGPQKMESYHQYLW